MNKNEVLGEISRIIDEVGTAVLGTVNAEGKPDLRWVNPVMLRGRSNAIFMVTYPGSKKVKELQENPRAQWLFQTRPLDVIVTVDGRVNTLENPSIRSEVLEVVGPRLHAFWKITPDERDLMVLETVIERAVYYKPMQGLKVPVEF
jgi:general stress protein 26